MLKTSDFDYHLPDERIAPKPVGVRSTSKLLVYEKGEISHTSFDQIGNFLPKNSLLVLNNSKVIPARIFFKNSTGASIELFLLEPYGCDHAQALSSTEPTIWKCLIGNRKRWKSTDTLRNQKESASIAANWFDEKNDLVIFKWSQFKAFAEILEDFGSIPLPPYLHRDSTEEDKIRYQTVYAKLPGAVAAPTAGLHFSERLLQDLESDGHQTSYLTLHVSAGTFLPVKTEDALQHHMHEEKVIYERTFLEFLVTRDRKFVAVGTTSMRALETLYWAGVRILNGDHPEQTPITQEWPYEYKAEYPSREKVISTILNWLDQTGKLQLHLSTSIFIRPGYRFGFCDGLITNFHQPKSTLLMLIGAFIGEDWKSVYKEALVKDYRFLSYGDSSLLLPK